VLAVGPEVDPLSIVPYRDTRRRPARQPLDRERIVQVAITLLDEVGIDGLTMRSLATALGAKAASLYRHVRDKEELLVLVADELSAEVPPMPRQGTWQQRARAMATAVRRTLLRHRDAARVLAETPPMGPRRLRQVEAALGLFLSAGFAPRDAVRAAYHFNNFVTELVADEARLEQGAASLGSTRRELMAGMTRTFRELPAGEFPALTALASELGRDDFDGLFEFGLEVWLGGLERHLRRARR
jgi:TetR/AcrR family tetracycline transcriptional repressor